MSKILFRIALLSVVTLLLAFGSAWPPRETAFKHHFEAHRKSFERLEEKLRSSSYTSVSKDLANRHGIHVKLGDKDDLVSVEDTAGWRELLLDTSTITVSLADGGFRALVMMSQDNANRVTSAVYAHDVSFYNELPKCLPEHQSIRCGMCYVALEEQWALVYEWWPGVMLPKAQEKARTGELSGSEYINLLEAEKNSCWREGSEQMGFDCPF